MARMLGIDLLRKLIQISLLLLRRKKRYATYHPLMPEFYSVPASCDVELVVSINL